MQHTKVKMNKSSRSLHHILLFSIIFMIIIGVDLFFSTWPALAVGRYFPKRYALRGDITLTYEEKWTTREDLNASRFTQGYHLGLSGFAIDPRLITFDVDTRFSSETNRPESSANTNTYGLDAALSIMNAPAHRGFFSHFPQPIIVTYSINESYSTKIQSYGINLGYDLFERSRIHRQFQQQQQMRRQQQQQNQSSGQQVNNNSDQQSGENIEQQKQGQGQGKVKNLVEEATFPFPLPVIFLDYDNNSYSFDYPSGKFEVDTDFLTLRLVDRGLRTDYLAEYNYNRYQGVANYTLQFLNIELNHRNYMDQKHQRFESFNRLFLTDLADSKSLEFGNRNIWTKSLGTDLRDRLSVAGGGSYFTSDLETNDTNYDLNAKTEYTKNFKKALNLTSAELSFGDSGIDTIYSVRLFDELNYDVSRALSVRGRTTVGLNELGDVFGAGTSLAIRKFINFLSSYDYIDFAASEGRTKNHLFSLDMNGRLYRNITFNSRNSYKIRDVNGSSPFNEKILDLRADLFWVLRLMSINFGVSRINTKSKHTDTIGGESPVDITVKSLYSNISAPLLRGMFMTVNTSYTKDMNGNVLSFEPVINWNLRQATLSAEYNMRKVSGEDNFTDHRIFFRFTRAFSRGIRGFW